MQRLTYETLKDCVKIKKYGEGAIITNPRVKKTAVIDANFLSDNVVYSPSNTVMTSFCKKIRWVTFASFLSNHVVFAQSTLVCQGVPTDIENTSIEELMEIPAFLSATQQATCANETANIVNIISNEQILNSGARDLIDVLQQVPGFTFGLNMSNEVNLGIRGIQADEGKMSVLVDGIMLTEQRFGTTAFGGHFPLEQIDHIEIIRGASSMKNGNFAEMGVINLITKNAKQAEGAALTTSYGRFERGEARKTISVAAGHTFDELEVSFSGKANESQRSDRIYTDAHQASIDMANNSQLDSLYGNLSLAYHDFKLRFLADEYHIESRDGFADAIMPANQLLKNTFNTYASNASYEHEFTPHFKANATFDFSRQSPWQRSTLYSNGKQTLDEKVLVDHYKSDAKATFMADSGSYLALGNSYQLDDYSHIVSDFKGTLPLFTDYVAYAEMVYKTPWVDFLAGGRFDAYGQFGTNLQPRFALTKQLDKFHYKLLYTHAFHVPTGGDYQMNIEFNQTNTLNHIIPALRPEKARNYEAEMGYRFSSHFDGVVNVFYTQIQHIFNYSFDSNFDDYYVNSAEQSTYGIESMLRYQHAWLGSVDVNYAFYHSVKNTAAAYYQVTNAQGDVLHAGMNLGFPTHKATLNHTFHLSENISFNHQLIYFSDRYGGDGVHYPSEWLYNTYLRYQNLPVKGAEVGLGLYDIFNTHWQYVQQFNGGHPALPAETRELMLRFSYKL
ncbi:MAG TPA: ABC transporter ATP-binding protein [Methylococcaceae bacterium]|nr:ABC transporter ATP-binding protein [Methylococcaceae bacterium]